MWIDHANLVSFLGVLCICLLRLIGEVIGYGDILFKGMPFLWLSLSLGFLFTWQVVFKGLEVYSVIFIWLRESLSRLLKNIFSGPGNWAASVNWNSLIALSVLVWPIRDMTIRWNMVHYRWAISFPPYAQMLLHVAAVLYIVFIVIQGQFSYLCMKLFVEQQASYHYCLSQTPSATCMEVLIVLGLSSVLTYGSTKIICFSLLLLIMCFHGRRLSTLVVCIESGIEQRPTLLEVNRTTRYLVISYQYNYLQKPGSKGCRAKLRLGQKCL